MILKDFELLSEFRGLPAGYTISFNKSIRQQKTVQDGTTIAPICLVGLNGSGKSNILEVLAEVFYYLETYHKADRFQRNGLSRYQTKFGFIISYVLPRVTVLEHLQDWQELQASLSNTNEDPLITITKPIGKYPSISAMVGNHILHLNNKDNDREPGILPPRVIGYSSGMNELLSNPFIKVDFQYLNDLNRKAKESADSRLVMNRLFFMNYDTNKYITVSNFMFDAADFDLTEYSNLSKATDFGGINLKHLKTETGIKDVAFFSLQLQLEKPADNSSNYLPSELNIALDRFKACATFHQSNEVEAGKNKVRKTIQYDFWVNRATKEAFRDQFGTAYELFRAFYFLQLLNNDLVGAATRQRVSTAKSGDIENLSEELPRFEKEQLRFRLHNIKLKNRHGRQVEYRKLSDGEHQLLQVLGSVLLMDAPGTLFLLDEPETHFNPDWRSKFVRLINKSIISAREQELLLTTHSPFIITDCQRENVFVFERDQKGYIKKPKNPGINTYGTAVSVITDEIFGRAGTLSDMSLETIRKIKNMPMKTKANIQAAKEAARVLGDSPEKVLLFREILFKEEQLRGKDA